MIEFIVKPKPIQGIDKLTAKELEIIQEIADGFSSKEISIRLGITLKTVEVHRYRIMKKTEAKNFIQIVLTLYKEGIVK